MEKKKVAIVGCGAVAYRWYFDGLLRSNYCEIIALVDIDKDRLLKASEYCGVSRLYLSLDSLIDDKELDVDIVVLLTPHKYHYEQIKSLLNARLNVYSEKPFAETTQQAVELLDLAEQNELVFCSAPQVMLSSRNKFVKKYIESDLIGDVVMVRASGSNMGPAYRKDTNYDPEWFYNDGGSLSSLGIYTLALIVFLFGMPLRVSGFSGVSMAVREIQYGPAKGKVISVTAPDNEVAILDYGTNYVLFDGSYVVAPAQEYELIIHGTKGSLYVGGFGGKNSIVLKKNELIEYIGPEDRCHIDWNLSWGIDEMSKAMDSNTVSPTNARFAFDTIRLIEAIRESSKNSEMIKME